ncbi:MAG: sialidase family protein [Chlamydiota bacterium]
MNRFFYIFFGVFLMHSTLHSKENPIVCKEFVMKNPSTPFCHASTLCENRKGEILCSWYEGSDEGASDVTIALASRDKHRWSQPKTVARGTSACWNPVLYQDPAGTIFLFYKVGPNPQRWSGSYKCSYDEGEEWGEEQKLPAGVFGPVKNRPILLEDGALLCGSSTESWKRWGCWIDCTRDQGKTWEKYGPINVPEHLYGTIQPALVKLENRVVRMFTRSLVLKKVCVATSYDGGVHWTSLAPTSLPNPNSAVDAILLADGRMLIVYNHSETKRSPLNLALSSDGGKTWCICLTLENEPGSFSYPSVIQSKNGHLHISYTWNRENIKYVEIDPKFL